MSAISNVAGHGLRSASIEKRHLEVMGKDDSACQLGLLFCAEVSDGAAEEVDGDGDDVVEGDHAVVIQHARTKRSVPFP